MIVFSLLLGCVPEKNNDGFGIVGSAPEQTLDTSEEVKEEENEPADDLSEDPEDLAVNNPLYFESGTVCGNRTVGTDIGDCASNFGLLDRNGEVVQLHTYAGSVIFLDLSGFG